MTGTKVPSQCTAVKDTGLVKDIRLCQIPLMGPTGTCSFSQSGREGSVGHSRKAACRDTYRSWALAPACRLLGTQACQEDSEQLLAALLPSSKRRGSWRHLKVKAGHHRKCLPGLET